MQVSRWWLLAVTLVVATGASACGGSGSGGAEATVTEAVGSVTAAVGSVTENAGSVAESLSGAEIALQEQNGSGESGTATLSLNDDGSVHVSLQLSGAPAEAQPAHIHKGTCANLDPNPAFPLTNVVTGSSETDVQVSLEDLAAGPYAINIHKSETEADIYVACGDITNLSP